MDKEAGVRLIDVYFDMEEIPLLHPTINPELWLWFLVKTSLGRIHGWKNARIGIKWLSQPRINYTGTSAKSLHISVNASLKKLCMSYIMCIGEMERGWLVSLVWPSPWSVLATGKLHSNKEEKCCKESGEKGCTMYGSDWEHTEAEVKAPHVLEKVVKEVGANSISVGNTTNMEALDISLTEVYIKELKSVIPFDVGFPMSLVV
ncbi:hypothetical protein BDP27DRAFT_1367106 [Rhodocollybia butyracea]|uniref:Uncharacterized protein n=1 Tax=Rhodocollybia butyracea TaxID=206335 RepID=A0A9P5PMA1_9AGAR|nr:hypothetical protein BDP27DRAFT_1367106 [Rhodocollybia butyracea]